MILNGKAKEDFLEYYWENRIKPLSMSICKKQDLGEFFETIMDIMQNALIIEWLDSVKIFINIKSKFGQKKQCERFSFNVRNYNSGFMFNSRQEATEKAIEKAVEIYNNQKS